MKQIICKICGSNDIENVFKNSDKILRCNNCGIAFLSPDAVISRNDYYSEAEHYSEAPKREYQVTAFIRGACARLKFINKYINLKNKNLLDVGAHFGTFVKEANNLGVNATGIEPNKNLVDWAKNQGSPVIEGYFEDFKPQETFDIITIFHVLDHVSDPNPIIKKAGDILRQGGFLIIEVPNIESYSAKNDEIFWKFINIEHNFYYSERGLKKLLDGLEFKIVSVKKWNFELENRGIKGMLRTYIFGHESPVNRLQPRSAFKRPKEISEGSGVKQLIRKSLAFFINIIGRGDNILVIARKI